MESYKNHYININRSQGISSSQKRALNSFDSSSNISKLLNSNQIKYKQSRSYIKYNKDKTKAIITNNSIIQGIGLHFFEFNIKENERRQTFYYDDNNILCGLIYDKYYKVAKYFRYEKKEIGRRRFRQMRRSFKNFSN